jgi:3-hydroxyacyl-[acyl-carrier-protein] dehydratase
MLKGKFYFAKDLVVDNNSVSATIELNPNHEIYKGHFPGKPVTPGVCQIQIVKEIIADVIKQDLNLVEAKSIKFLSVLSPDCKGLILDMTFAQNDLTVDVKARLSAGKQVYLKFSGRFCDPSSDT